MRSSVESTWLALFAPSARPIDSGFSVDQNHRSSMLTITEDAATLVRTLTNDAELSEQAGLRIVVDPVNHSLSMRLAGTPGPTDAVVDGHGARVFLSPSAAHRLDERTLGAEITEQRALFFLDR
jgi:Fe-S cluster assembly iron-binding protein IscA